MSDLWDYDDDDDQGDGGRWEAPPQDDGPTTHKRKAGWKSTKASKRRAAPPATSLELRPAPMPTTILLDDSGEDDDLVLITSPEVNANHSGAAGVSGTAGAARIAEPPAVKPGGQTKPGVATLNPATRESLAREEELLRALQQVTEREDQQDDDMEASPISPVSHLGLSRLTSRRPMAVDVSGVGAAKPTSAPYLSDDDDLVVAADVPVLGSTAAQNGLGQEDPTVAQDDNVANGAGARVQLKLVWGRDKDDSVKMRVVKTDPFSKMIEKFKAYAMERSICRDPNKIKFLFDGDDLAKMPTETPESMDMEDDMTIDVKL
ncbi:hypothetical protein VOLCADRAFT_98979 [Volvox carteri f. nagariensis]|uniref:Rad60/SUMO-like domain-containing protein n=1 Tax=Volvox carteri f. nagariensis TaxID=3068 RepID=D8UGR4_VOLCA|nr:uncharacterized protein VOLCADRAFT_98979 [Volvox carteri f. nagariensis]EFJ41095.1 hypothetical protein VOLCADRAFT_98979 [Volvox carteri f. nagariensis]|eukprot:XP_002957858.1 hypothetical protein VOLCADRAFT_98979 [Volvox carteri f. nagariensis]